MGKLLILNRNQKGFLLSPVYKHLKGIFAYTSNEKTPDEKKQQHVSSFSQNNPV